MIGSLFALTLAFPSVRVADVLAIFGIVSVAAGFAFKDTFENLLAGVLLLLRDPFKSGDEITVADRAGTVEGVTARETLLRSPDGQLFHPQRQGHDRCDRGVHDTELRRQLSSLRFTPDTDFTAVRAVLVAALGKVDEAGTAPPPSVLLTAVVDGDVVVECRFWAGSRRSDASTALDRSIAEALCALAEHEIEQPVDLLRLTLDQQREHG